ncbi:hypothetical protein [Burkholderia sp. Ac-20353]|uniref:hypothetical protein n=1 Tax=Burkholderia sp. Ac-20353 TaxID=2703894 RepID=UPI001F11D152|nr:hypothetical protein [Burkholderia sp. Ac-20353]
MPIFLFCLLLFMSVSAQAGSACDALLGEFAPAPDKPATLRVEKVDGEIVLRASEAGQWSVETEPTRESKADANDPDRPAADACVLMIPGGELIKLPVGAPYQVTSLYGNGWTTKHSTTGVLLLSMAGFQVDGTELYPVARSGDSPPAPVKAVPGQEVTGAGLCPGRRAPDMSQADFDALPESLRQYYAGLEPGNQRKFVCGQMLDEIMSGSMAASDDGQKRDNLWHWFDVLLRAHQVPRDGHGSDDRWYVATYLLRQIRPDSGAAVPAHRERDRAIVLGTLLPNLPPPDTLRNGREEQASALVAEIVKLPEADALAALGSLHGRGMLRWQPHENNPYRVADIALQDALSPSVPAPVFALLAKDARPDVLNDDALLDGEVTEHRDEGVRRLLAAGVKPSVQTLAHAEDNPAIRQLLQDAVAH